MALGLLAVTACEKDELELEKNLQEKNLQKVNENVVSNVTEGAIRVKLTREMGDALNSSENAITKSGNSVIDNYLAEIGAVKMERVFPYHEEFEERTRKAGLHLWYDIEFDKSNPVTKVAGDIKNLKGISIVEELILPSFPKGKITVSNPEETKASNGLPMNDPGLNRQWHYNNTGTQVQNSVAGADINLFEAWKTETGSSKIIVSVVDGGIDYDHEDLKANMWSNTKEIPNNGIDDDKNGYIDDVNGWNFVYNDNKIVAEGHGTHVAGTVSAVNNNNIGVCGVAGGNGTYGTGVKLMSCQVFEGESGATTANFARAIKYGADNGALISQNSWGFVYPGVSSIPASLKDAIDYFTQYAGCDAYGNQKSDSPMKGGIVIFAAGNDNKDYLSYPAAYDGVVAVSSMAPNFVKAYYTNRGAWVDIMAPGGEQSYNNDPRGVYSTLPDNTYGFYQGTSMACPHVSGIAALMISKYGRQGYTSETLRRDLLSSLRNERIDTYNSSAYSGRLGIGYIDAGKAVGAEAGNDNPGGDINNTVPELIKAFGSFTATVGTKGQLTLSNYFRSYNGSALTYTATSSSNSIASVSISGDILVVTPNAAGTCTISVTAKDINGGTLTESFTLTVKEDSNSGGGDVTSGLIADVSYQAPYLNIDVATDIRYCQISIYDSNYTRRYNKFTYFYSNTSRYFQINLSSLTAGTYTLYIVANDGKKQTHTLTVR